MYGKFFASTFTGSMAGKGPVIHAVWSFVIANTVDGQVELNPAVVAGLIGGMTEAQAREAIEFLCAPDANSRNPEEEGRRLIREGSFAYKVVSHEIYKNIRNQEERREYNRKAQRKSRAAKKLKAEAGADVSNQMSALSAHGDRDGEGDLTGRDPDLGSSPSPDSSARGRASEQEADHGEEDPAPPRGARDSGGAVCTPLQRKAERYVMDPTTAMFEYGAPETWPEVIAANAKFLDAYPAAGKLRARDLRAVTIVERFAQGFTVDELDRAARGSLLDPHISGNASFQMVRTIWRDESQVLRFIALLQSPPKTSSSNGASERIAEHDRHVAELRRQEGEQDP